MNILIVDDGSTTRRILGVYLKNAGYDTVYAINGIDAIEKLDSNDVNLIITDVSMPFMDGIEFTRAVKSNPLWKHIPVVIVATEQDEVEKENSFGAGVDGYIVKPFTTDAIKEKIEKILDNLSEL